MIQGRYPRAAWRTDELTTIIGTRFRSLFSKIERAESVAHGTAAPVVTESVLRICHHSRCSRGNAQHKGFLELSTAKQHKVQRRTNASRGRTLRRVRPRRRFREMPAFDPDARALISGPDLRPPVSRETQPGLFPRDFAPLPEASPEPENLRFPGFVPNDGAC